MPLTPAEVAILATASASEIAASANRVRRHFSSSRWLAPRNRYRANVLEALRRDDAPAGTIRARNLAEYIAASVPIHCCDGWAFLGRAMGCHLRGDSDTARHLAYYAELRAAMCLLAANGIGVFRNSHFVIDGSGDAHRVSSDQTHRAAWDLLEAWSNQPGAATLLAVVLQPGGRPMEDWLLAMPGGTSWQPIATTWLQRMGLDVQVFGVDRDARNEASYRPTRLRPADALAAANTAELACQLWRLLEPTPPITFAQVDRYLARLTLEMAFLATSGSSHRQAPVRFRNTVDAIVSSVVNGEEADLWKAFLLRQREPDDPDLLRFAGRVTAIRQPNHHAAVMGRAMLLLRVASGAARHMLIQAGIGLDDIAFWWHPYGEDRGLWGRPPAAVDLTDSWADAEEVLEQLGIVARQLLGAVIDSAGGVCSVHES